MSNLNRIFRVFVSSTFSDFKAERDALQSYVWPALTELCSRYGARFQAIDLRWGVSVEAGLDQQTIPICLREIERCQYVSPKPNFILLLGDRYGWRPLPSSIPAHEMDLILRNISEEEYNRLIWSETQEVDENGWYRRDDNALPPEYVLLPRNYDSRYADAEEWAIKEGELMTILERGMVGLPAGTFDLLKYGTSATEQEIHFGTFRIQNATEHVHCFFRSIKEMPDNLVSLPTFDIARDFRDYAYDGSIEQSTQDWQSPLDRLITLKKALQDLLGSNIHEMNGVRWFSPGQGPRMDDGTISPISLDHLDQFCLDVFSTLCKIIMQELSCQKDIDPQLVEERAHDTYLKQLNNVFIGRRDLLDIIASSLLSDKRYPLLLYGISGVGKSALIAKAASEAWISNGGQPYDTEGLLQCGIAYSGARIVVRFIGATINSTDCHTLLQSICQQIARDYQSDTDIPGNFNGLVNYFSVQLTHASAEKPLIIFIDAIDQLNENDNARAMLWLPTHLPQYVHIIISFTTDPKNPTDKCYRAIEHRIPDDHRIAIGLLQPEESEELLETWLTEAKRTLDGGSSLKDSPNGQRAMVLDHHESSGLPVYLRLAFEEACSWHSFSSVHANQLAQDVPGIIRNLLDRLSDDFNHGPILVKRSLGLLAASKNGISENELLEMLSPVNSSSLNLNSLNEHDWKIVVDTQDDWAVLADYYRRSPHSPRVCHLPIVLWSRLSFDLQPYLSEHIADGTSLIIISHRQFREVIIDYFLKKQELIACHRRLAEYFIRQPLEIWPKSFLSEHNNLLTTRLDELSTQVLKPFFITTSAKTNSHPNLRKLSELPYAQILAGAFNELITTLTDPEFGEVKVREMAVWALISDYDLALQTLSSKTNDVELTKNISGFKRIKDSLQLSAEALSRSSKLYRSQLTGRLIGCDIPVVQTLIRTACEFDRTPWIKSLSKCLVIPETALLKTWMFPDVKTIVALPNREIIALGTKGGGILLWDMEQSLCLHSFYGHNAPINALAVSPDGKYIVSASMDNTMKIWNMQTGQLHQTLNGHQRSVSCLKVTPDGTRIISGSSDSTIKIWDLLTGNLLRTIEGSMTEITSLAVSGDSKRVLSGCFQVFIGWNIDNGNQLGIWQGPGTCSSLALSKDGRWAISGFLDQLTLWDLDCDKKVGDLHGHITDHYINAICFSDDAYTAITAGGDGTLRIWNLTNGTLTATLRGHKSSVTCIAFTSDKNRIVSCAENSTIKVWDLNIACSNHEEDKDTHEVLCMDVSSDGLFAASGNHDGIIDLWNITNRVKEFTIKASYGPICGLSLIPDSLCSVSVSLDVPLKQDVGLERIPGPTIVTSTGSTECTIQVGCLTSGMRKSSWKGHSGFVKPVVVCFNGRYAATGSADMTIKIWNHDSGECIRILEGHKDIVWDIAVSPDGEQLVSASFDKSLKVWDIRSGTCLHTISDLRKKPNIVIFMHERQKVIVGFNDGSIDLWDTDIGKMHNIVPTGHGKVCGMALCPGHDRIIAAFADCMLKLIDIPGGNIVANFQFEQNVGPLAVTPDGLNIVIGAITGHVHFLRLMIHG